MHYRIVLRYLLILKLMNNYYNIMPGEINKLIFFVDVNLIVTPFPIHILHILLDSIVFNVTFQIYWIVIQIPTCYHKCWLIYNVRDFPPY